LRGGVGEKSQKSKVKSQKEARGRVGEWGSGGEKSKVKSQKEARGRVGERGRMTNDQ